jgi:hypothetical protein
MREAQLPYLRERSDNALERTIPVHLTQKQKTFNCQLLSAGAPKSQFSAFNSQKSEKHSAIIQWRLPRFARNDT